MKELRFAQRLICGRVSPAPDTCDRRIHRRRLLRRKLGFFVYATRAWLAVKHHFGQEFDMPLAHTVLRIPFSCLCV